MIIILFLIAFCGGIAIGVIATVTWYIVKGMEPQAPVKVTEWQMPRLGLGAHIGAAPRLDRGALTRD